MTQRSNNGTGSSSGRRGSKFVAPATTEETDKDFYDDQDDIRAEGDSDAEASVDSSVTNDVTDETKDSDDSYRSGRYRDDNDRDTRNDSYRDNGRDSYRENGRDSYRDNGRDSYRDSGRDSYREGGRDSYRDSGRDSYRDSGRDSYREGGRDSYRDGGRDSYRNDSYREGAVGARGGEYRSSYRQRSYRNSNDTYPRNGSNSTYQGRNRRYQKNNPLAPKKPKSSSTYPEASASGDVSSFYKISGVLELHPNGYGFLRDQQENFVRQTTDPFVPGGMIEKFGLREGVLITGLVQPGVGEQGPRVREIYDVDGMFPEDYSKVKLFDELTPITPEHWLQLETAREPISTRVMDILTPLGKGQRALIVAPPRSGKTILLQQISQAITLNHPNVEVFVLLIDERPEEVTDFKRAVKASVISSSLDCELESHVRLAQFTIQRCKRLAEMGKDVFLLLDSITRLARAFNKWVGNTGRTMTGGVDIKAMDIPKKIFSSARQNEEGGSLTIVGTALIDTGSRMDELIFQEFKGTGNMELVLDRKLADRRIWPAIDITQSGTRREEKLLPEDFLRATTMLRRTLSPMNPVDAMEQLAGNLAKTETNVEFFLKFMHHR